MRIFLAGGSGAIGRRLIPLLVSDGHEVVATTRTPARAEAIRAAGAQPVVLDGLDRNAVLAAVAAARPETIVHQMTSLSTMRDLRRIDRELATTNRLRTEGIEHLLEAARRSGARRFVAQSYAMWLAGSGPRMRSESDPYDDAAPRSARRTVDAIRTLEATVSGAKDVEGVVLRYGSFYGPGTALGAEGEMVALVRSRKLPIVGGGNGVWSFVHIDDAARATRLAITEGEPGIYNVADDEPAEVSVWLPELARAVGAPAPRRIPRWLGRLFIGEAGIFMMEKARGWSNAKARRALRWTPIHRTWREGFRAGL
jgi:nucleoside-diphosphate-sugar epimerase